MIIQNFDLNLIPDSAPVVVHCDQYDRGTGRLVISLYEGSIAYSPSGTAVIQGVKPDGKGFDYNCTLSGNTVTADLTEQMTAVAGQVRTQIVVTESTGRTGTFVFILDVQRSALPADTDMSESDYQLIEQAIEEAQGAVEDSEAWAVGERSGVPVPSGDETYNNNAKYWAEQAAQYAQGGIIFKGSVAFASIPTTGMADGDMYNITNDFTTDSRFIEGAGKECAAGTNIVWIEDVEKWDIFAMSKIGSLDDLNDVNISSPTNGQGLLYNSTTQEWENTNIPSGGASALDDLTDVEITTPSSGQVLKYDGSKWVNGAGGSASGDYIGLYGDTLVGSDLNNITSVGNYYNDGTVTVSHYPSNAIITATSSFRLTVEKMGDSASTNLRQTYVLDNSVDFVFERHRTSGNWSSWQKVLTSYSNIGELDNVDISSPTNNQVLTYNSTTQKWENANAQGGSGDYVGLYGMTEIQSSDGQGSTLVNLDDYTTIGNYYCNGKALIQFRYYQYVGDPTGYQVYGRPSAVFLLYVRKISGTYIIQTLYVNNSGSLVKFERSGNYNGSTWGFTYWSIPIKRGSNYGGQPLRLNNYAFADVYVNSRETNDVLVYDKALTRWENKPVLNDLYKANGILGAKNLFPNEATSQTINGVTFTVNADGSVTINGTASTFTAINLWNGHAKDSFFKQGVAYRATNGNPRARTNDSDNGFGIRLYRTGSPYPFINGFDGEPFVVPDEYYSPQANNLSISIDVTGGATVNNETVYPMIRLATDTDDTYVPYAMTNRELTEKLEVEDVTITPSGNVFDASHLLNIVCAKRMGKIVIISGNMPIQNALTNDTVIFSVSEPPIARVNIVLGYANAEYKACAMYIGTDGNVKAYGAIPANANYCFSFMYLTK